MECNGRANQDTDQNGCPEPVPEVQPLKKFDTRVRSNEQCKECYNQVNYEPNCQQQEKDYYRHLFSNLLDSVITRKQRESNPQEILPRLFSRQWPSPIGICTSVDATGFEPANQMGLCVRQVALTACIYVHD
jgi:hypothetical protein